MQAPGTPSILIPLAYAEALFLRGCYDIDSFETSADCGRGSGWEGMASDCGHHGSGAQHYEALGGQDEGRRCGAQDGAQVGWRQTCGRIGGGGDGCGFMLTVGLDPSLVLRPIPLRELSINSTAGGWGGHCRLLLRTKKKHKTKQNMEINKLLIQIQRKTNSKPTNGGDMVVGG